MPPKSGQQIVIERELADTVLDRTKKALRDKRRNANRPRQPIVEWSETNFYIPETGQPLQWEPFQKAVLKCALDRLEPDSYLLNLFPSLQGRIGHFPFRLIVFSAVKKQGKTTMAAVMGRWIAEEQTRFGQIFTMGNDLKQAKERSFAMIMESIMMSPGFRHRGIEGWLPERWLVQATRMACISSGSKIEALSVDARGEAGANPDLTIWTELWGFEDPAAVKFFYEMTPPPTKADSIRLIETYAGFDGESMLLRSQFDLGKSGRQLTAGELEKITGIPKGCFKESPNEDDPVPIWINEAAGMFMFWDSGLQARRMSWQKGDIGNRYYEEEELKFHPSEFIRIHLNEWVGGEGDFIPMGSWDKCYDPDLSFLEPGDKTPAVLAVDAATTGDCFGVVLITRHPKRPKDPAIRACRKWDPRERGGKLDYDEPEAFIRTIIHGGCIKGHPQYKPFRNDPKDCPHTPANACEQCCEACASKNLVLPYNIIEIAYDPYQLESMMGRLYKEAVNCQPFNQMRDRLIADSMFYDVIIQGHLSHDGNPMMREHILNCGAKQSKEEDTKLRIVKKQADRKIDLAVAASMGVRRITYLLI